MSAGAFESAVNYDSKAPGEIPFHMLTRKQQSRRGAPKLSKIDIRRRELVAELMAAGHTIAEAAQIIKQTLQQEFPE